MSAATSASQDTSRLVSVQKLSDNFNDACAGDESGPAEPPANIDSREEQTLFSALQGDPFSVLMAAAQRQRENTFPHAEQEEREAAEARVTEHARRCARSAIPLPPIARSR